MHTKIISIATLKTFWESPEYADAKLPLLAWRNLARNAEWESPADLQEDLRSASILRDGRAVFNIGGNKYRLAVWIDYPYEVVYIRQGLSQSINA